MELASTRIRWVVWIVLVLPVTTTCEDYTPSAPSYTSRIVYVDASNLSDASGSSWAKAFPTLQQGIDTAAEFMEQHGSVFTAEVWVAKGTYHVFESSESDTVLLQQNIAIFGGFAGTETEGERTLRDWNLNQTILDGRSATGSGDRVHHVVTVSQTGNTVLDGFTIRSGRITESNPVLPENSGAGMLVINSSPTIKNCRFENNEADRGGGMSIYGNYHPEGESVLSTTVSNTVFAGNFAKSGGGGVFSISNGSVFEDCIFEKNHTEALGGGLVASDSKIKVRNCTFRNNHARHGGGIYAVADGQDVYPLVSNTVFHSNTANNGAGLFSHGNFDDGGGIQIRNSTFSNNAASISGGAIQTNNNCPEIENSILFGNVPQEIEDDGCQTTVSSSIVEGGWQGAWNEDPKFLAPPEDLRIHQSSFAIDRGDPNKGTIDDLAGNSRWDMPGTGEGESTIDLGAYEYAQGLLSGSVTNGNSGEPIADVRLEIYPSPHSEPILPPLTDSLGNWGINGSDSLQKWIWQRHNARAIKIVASKTGYNDLVLYKQIALEDGRDEIDFVMFPDSVSTRDDDHDGLWDEIETLFGASPGITDTDGDGLPDGWEVWGHHWVDYTFFGYAPDFPNDWLNNVALNPPQQPGRSEIVPVFFMPTDLPANKRPSQKDKNLFLAYLRLAQERYRYFLRTDTFRISSTDFLMHHGNGANWYYCREMGLQNEEYPYDNEPSQARLETGELMEYYQENFDTTNKIFVVVYVNPLEGSESPPANSMWHEAWETNSGGVCVSNESYPSAGARPMWNIAEMDSGGVVQLSYNTLVGENWALSTITHELGHAFGLVHIESRGSFVVAGDNEGKDIFSKNRSPSVMSYNVNHWSFHFEPRCFDPTYYDSSYQEEPDEDIDDWFHYRHRINRYNSLADNGMLLPEELYVLDEYADSVFPDLDCDSYNSLCTPTGRNYQGDPDNDFFAKITYAGQSTEEDWNNEFHRNRLIPIEEDGFGKHGFGYELFIDNTKTIHRPFISHAEAQLDCDANQENSEPTQNVECYYNGVEFE